MRQSWRDDNVAMSAASMPYRKGAMIDELLVMAILSRQSCDSFTFLRCSVFHTQIRYSLSPRRTSCSSGFCRENVRHTVYLWQILSNCCSWIRRVLGHTHTPPCMARNNNIYRYRSPKRPRRESWVPYRGWVHRLRSRVEHARRTQCWSCIPSACRVGYP